MVHIHLKGVKKVKYCADEGNTIKYNRGGIGSWERFKIGKYNKPSLSLHVGNSVHSLTVGVKCIIWIDTT